MTPKQSERKMPSLLVSIFLISLFIPWVFQIGGMRLSLYRIVLIAVIVPCFIAWLNGKAGRIRLTDIALLLFCSWGALSLAMVHGGAFAMQPGGVLFVETMGAYLLARCYIRDANDFYNVVRLLFWIVAALLPFAVFEAFSGRNIALELFAAILPSHPLALKEARLDLRRVQAVFEHPILFGVCCGSILVLTHMVLGYKTSVARRWKKSVIVGITAGLSLSSGPISAMAMQIALMLWNWVLRKHKARWKILIALVSGAVMMVQIFANRSLAAILFWYFALDVQSAYFRILIWNFGSQSALNHPLFGVGFGEWDRPSWMPPSIDMFWLYNAIVYGIPAGFFMLLAFFSAILTIGIKRGLDDKHQVYRTAYIIAMAGLFLVGWMVHFWNATYVLFVFLMGSGLWILDSDAKQGVLSRRDRHARRSHARGKEFSSNSQESVNVV